MPRYHISEKTDRPNICRAKPGNCPLKSGDEEVPHFNTKEEAKAHIEEKNAEKYSEVASTQKKAHSKKKTKNFFDNGTDFSSQDLDEKTLDSLADRINKGNYTDKDLEDAKKLADHLEDIGDYHHSSTIEAAAVRAGLKNGSFQEENLKKSQVYCLMYDKENTDPELINRLKPGFKKEYNNAVINRGGIEESVSDAPVKRSDSYGNTYWTKNGKYHREDGPAIEYSDGSKEWYRNGRFHREDGPAVERPNGYKEWRINGKLHREDGPAIEYASGAKKWYKNGQLHREDGPAVEESNGWKEWYINGRLHREDGPAFELPDGTKEWHKDGLPHREDGPAFEHPDGTKEWYINGRLHREDGPALELPDGRKEWYKNGELHRKDGPAVEFSDGSKEWWTNGIRVRFEK